MIEKILIAYLIWNVVVMLVFGVDKLLAKMGAWRISEKTLFTLAALLGAAGAWAGMRIFRHKTRHNSFVYGIPILAFVNLAVVYFIIYRLDI